MSCRRWIRAEECPPGFQRHHLIPLALFKRPQFEAFFSALEDDGLRLSRFSDNGLRLPSDEDKAAATGHALHRGPHPAYSDVVMARIDQIRQGTAIADQRARWMAVARMKTLQSALRRSLTDRHGHGLWLNRRDPMRIFADRPYLDDAITALFAAE